MPIKTAIDIDSGIQPPDKSIYEAVSAIDIKAALIKLQEKESSIKHTLNSYISSPNHLTHELGRLDLLRAQIGLQAVATRSISNGMLSNAATTATRISAAVKRLDLEQSRVEDTLNIVEQVVELKTCVLGLTGSMGAPQDWETAAMYLSRASKIPKDIIDSPFAEELVPTAEVPDPPRVTLENAAESLRGLFLREFEKAAGEGNGARITRFFKLFPLIGKSDVGLDVYGRYICQGVAARARARLNAGPEAGARRDDFFYADALTKLFEHIAQIVEDHGALVEAHYGLGRMTRVVERLQLEADVQGGIIIDTWSDDRGIDRRLTDIRSYAFTFLVQSFLPGAPTKNATPRSGSPMGKGIASDIYAHDEGNNDMKALDGLLGEMAVMLGRWSLYRKFIAIKCKEPTNPLQDQSQFLTEPHLLVNASLSRKISNALIAPFNIMTTFFFRRSVEKAFQLDEQPQNLSLVLGRYQGSNSDHFTSAVDDVMYIVNQVFERSLPTSQREVIAGVVPSVSRVLGSDFVGMIQRKMRDECYPKAAVQGAPPPENTVISFILLINNLDVATDYLKRIVQRHMGHSPDIRSTDEDQSISIKHLASLYPFNDDATYVSSALHSLQQIFSQKTSELINDGIFVLFKNVIKPRLRPILTEAFRDIEYHSHPDHTRRSADGIETEIDNDEASTELLLNVQNRFQQGWDILTQPIKKLFTNRNYEKLLSIIISYLAEILEKRIWSYNGRLNDLGAVRLERDIMSVIGVAVRGGRYGLRDAFTRCTQICMIMNMEEDEWEELQTVAAPVGGQAGDDDEDDAISWAIQADERVRARAMVQDVR